MAHAERCPVCNGNGKVPRGFYDQTSGQYAGSAANPFEQCRSCGGKGYIVVPDFVPDKRPLTRSTTTEGLWRTG